VIVDQIRQKLSAAFAPADENHHQREQKQPAEVG